MSTATPTQPEAVRKLELELSNWKKYAQLGGVPTGKKCRTDGHDIYGPFIADENLQNAICYPCYWRQHADDIRKLVEAARAAEFALRAPDALLVEESRAALSKALKPFAPAGKE